MSRSQGVLLGCLLAAAVLVGWIAMRTRQPPLLPRDEDHARFVGADECLVCHGTDGAVPQSRNHPLGRDCMRCHGRR